MADVNALLTLFRRLDVLSTWGSVGRVAGWSLVWCLAASAVVVPFIPAADRAVEPDVPPSDVAYVGPTSLTDFAGFLPPADDDETFTIAWIGGSEIKLGTVSVAAAVDRRIASVGGQPVRTVVSSLLAPRTIDVIRALDTAGAAGVDAVVVALNPTWTRSGLSLRGWDNLDVSNVGALWRDVDTLPWAAAITSPDDLAWRISRATIGAVEGQFELNEYAVERLDSLDLVLDPEEPVPPEIDPRLPDSDSFWLVQEHGTQIVGDEPARVEALMRGAGLPSGPARGLIDELFERLDALDVPVYAYASPLNPELLVDPSFNEAAALVEAFWSDLADDLEADADAIGGAIVVDARMWSRNDARARGIYGDAIHMVDAEPFGEFLAARVCAHFRSVDAALECR